MKEERQRSRKSRSRSKPIVLSNFEKQLVQDYVPISKTQVPPLNLFWKNMVDADRKNNKSGRKNSPKNGTDKKKINGTVNDISDDVTVRSDSTLNESEKASTG